jgi:hypothetical protein
MPTTYEPIATSTISAGSTIYFSSIPSTWTDLRIVACLVNTISSSSVHLQFNSDAGTNYSRTNLRTGSAGVISQRGTGVNDIRALNWTTVSTFPGLVTFDILSYGGSTHKTTLITASADGNGAESSQVNRTVGMWRNTAAITSIDVIFNNSDVSGNVTLYGIKAT